MNSFCTKNFSVLPFTVEEKDRDKAMGATIGKMKVEASFNMRPLTGRRFPTLLRASQPHKLPDTSSKQSFKESASTSMNILKKRERDFSEEGEVVEGRRKYLRLQNEKGVLGGTFELKVEKKLTAGEEGRKKNTQVEGQNGGKESFGLGKNEKKRAFFLTVPSDDKEKIPESDNVGKLTKISKLSHSDDGPVISRKRPIEEFSVISTGKRILYTTFLPTLFKKRKETATDENSRDFFNENDTGKREISEGKPAKKRFWQTLLKKRIWSEENSSSGNDEEETEGSGEPLKEKVQLNAVGLKEEKDLKDHWKEAIGRNEQYSLSYWRGKREYLEKVDEFLNGVAVEDVHASFRKWMLRDPCDAPLYPNPKQVEEENIFSEWLKEVSKDEPDDPKYSDDSEDFEDSEEPENTFSDPTASSV